MHPHGDLVLFNMLLDRLRGPRAQDGLRAATVLSLDGHIDLARYLGMLLALGLMWLLTDVLHMQAESRVRSLPMLARELTRTRWTVKASAIVARILGLLVRFISGVWSRGKARRPRSTAARGGERDEEGL